MPSTSNISSTTKNLLLGRKTNGNICSQWKNYCATKIVFFCMKNTFAVYVKHSFHDEKPLLGRKTTGNICSHWKKLLCYENRFCMKNTFAVKHSFHDEKPFTWTKNQRKYLFLVEKITVVRKSFFFMKHTFAVYTAKTAYLR